MNVDPIPRLDIAGGKADGLAVADHAFPLGNRGQRDLMSHAHPARQRNRRRPAGDLAPNLEVVRGDADVVIGMNENDVDRAAAVAIKRASLNSRGGAGGQRGQSREPQLIRALTKSQFLPRTSTDEFAGTFPCAKASIMVRWRQATALRSSSGAAARRAADCHDKPSRQMAAGRLSGRQNGHCIRNTRSAPSPWPSGVRHVAYDAYIEGQLRQDVPASRAVDLATALMILVAGTLIYLFGATLIDHWAVSGGLGFGGRTIAWVLFLTGTLAWIGYALLPLVVRRINPVYAAQAIEQSRPTLKNSLVNFLLLRQSGASVSPSVLSALEQQAATSLSREATDFAVDSSKLVRLSWILLAIVAPCAVYKVASPKDPLRSFERVMIPWADIAPPTRVVISAVEPGNTKAFRDHFVSVSGRNSGLGASEDATLYYSTADGQIVAKAVLMVANGLTYKAELPPHSGGLQQDVEYWLAAGDAQSATTTYTYWPRRRSSSTQFAMTIPPIPRCRTCPWSGREIFRPSKEPKSRSMPRPTTRSRRPLSISSATARVTCRWNSRVVKPRSPSRSN